MEAYSRPRISVRLPDVAFEEDLCQKNRARRATTHISPSRVRKPERLTPCATMAAALGGLRAGRISVLISGCCQTGLRSCIPILQVRYVRRWALCHGGVAVAITLRVRCSSGSDIYGCRNLPAL